MTGELAKEEGRFQRFCVVGLGNHARTKLIPAIIANGQQIVGFVTSQSGDDLPAAPVFRRLDEALSALPSDTVFVIATPPAMHFAQAMIVIKAGRDLILEKPAFITEREAVEAITESTRQGIVLVEAFMYRHTELYRRLMAFWRAERSSIEAIDATFLIPGIPAGTFRQDANVASSSLYDVGCYALSLLADLDLPLLAMDLTGVDFPGECDKEAVHLAGSLTGVHANVRIGVSVAYVNMVSFQTVSGQTTAFSPFFYGRSGEKLISHGSMSTTSQEVVRDENGFEEMFAVPRRVWLDGQPERAKRMIEVTAGLERLSHTLATLRNKGVR